MLDTTIDPTTLDPSARELDATKKQAMYPVFQRTFLTSAMKSIVLKQESQKVRSIQLGTDSLEALKNRLVAEGGSQRFVRWLFQLSSR